MGEPTHISKLVEAALAEIARRQREREKRADDQDTEQPPKRRGIVR